MERNKRYFWMEKEGGEEMVVEYPDTLQVVPFSPLLERIEAEKPELLPGMISLYEEMEKGDFQKYINDLIDIKIYQQEMMIITKNNMQKCILEKDYITLLKKSFSVERIRIVSQH